MFLDFTPNECNQIQVFETISDFDDEELEIIGLAWTKDMIMIASRTIATQKGENNKETNKHKYMWMVNVYKNEKGLLIVSNILATTVSASLIWIELQFLIISYSQTKTYLLSKLTVESYILLFLFYL